MRTIVFSLLILCTCRLASAQAVIQDPIANTVELSKKAGSYYKGRSYYLWSVDINHDGLQDLLVAEKGRPDEMDQERKANRWFFNPDNRGFYVYIRTSSGYILATVADDDKPEGNGITLDLSHCYVGYVSEINSYGIVTVEALTVSDPDEPQARHGVLKNQVVCHTVGEGRIVRANLTVQFDAGDENAIYKKYLSEARRTKVRLHEITP